jgi:hypothetical protein
MNLIARLTGTVARIVRDVAEVVTEAPAIHRELRQRRAAATTTTERIPAPLTEVDGEVPSVEAIEKAARMHEEAREATNSGGRLKRAADKVLKRVPDGVYGLATIQRFESSRQTADLDAIKALLELHGLGELPMKTCAPSLVITLAEESTAAGEAELALAYAA